MTKQKFLAGHFIRIKVLKIMNDFIYVMKSFRVPGKDSKLPLNPAYKMIGYEDGMTILFKTANDVENYLQALRDGKDDRPFEMRWDLLVVEKVYFGPYSQNEVIGWWRAKCLNNGKVVGYELTQLDKCPLPHYEDAAPIGSNFTIDS